MVPDYLIFWCMVAVMWATLLFYSKASAWHSVFSFVSEGAELLKCCDAVALYLQANSSGKHGSSTVTTTLPPHITHETHSAHAPESAFPASASHTSVRMHEDQYEHVSPPSQHQLPRCQQLHERSYSAVIERAAGWSSLPGVRTQVRLSLY